MDSRHSSYLRFPYLFFIQFGTCEQIYIYLFIYLLTNHAKWIYSAVWNKHFNHGCNQP